MRIIRICFEKEFCKGLLLWVMLFALLPVVQAQTTLYTTATGKTTFFSKAPLEDISAHNNAVSSVINTATSAVEVRIPVSKFMFENDLMQEHFNDDFMESSKYPAAIFTGRINEAVAWNRPGTYAVTATGILTIHGVGVPRTIKGQIQVGDNILSLSSVFVVKLEDHKIKVPKLLFQKIAEQIEVNNQFQYLPYKKTG